MSEEIVTPTQCRQIREQYSHREGFDPLIDEHDIEGESLRYHLYGDCSHDIDVEPITPPVEHQLGDDECRSIRERHEDGQDIRTILEREEVRWSPLVRHLTGNCTHENDAPTVERDGLLRRQPISASACAALREAYFEKDDRTILDIARDVRWSYPAVQSHINGQCSHDLETSSRTVDRRGADVSAEMCQEMRQHWRENPDITIEELAAEFGQAGQTIERHLKYQCPHESRDLLVDEMDVFEEWLRDRDEHEFEFQDVLEASTDADLDPEEVASDAGTPTEVETTVSRKIRNTAIVIDLKMAYEYRCQVCGDLRYRSGEEPYAEGHHVKPLGAPHKGPDVPGNILVLCPNHHADFDYGVIDVDPDTFEIRHLHDAHVDGTELNVDPEHPLDPEYLNYHSRRISTID